MVYLFAWISHKITIMWCNYLCTKVIALIHPYVLHNTGKNAWTESPLDKKYSWREGKGTEGVNYCAWMPVSVLKRRSKRFQNMLAFSWTWKSLCTRGWWFLSPMPRRVAQTFVFILFLPTPKCIFLWIINPVRRLFFPQRLALISALPLSVRCAGALFLTCAIRPDYICSERVFCSLPAQGNVSYGAKWLHFTLATSAQSMGQERRGRFIRGELSGWASGMAVFLALYILVKGRESAVVGFYVWSGCPCCWCWVIAGCRFSPLLSLLVSGCEEIDVCVWI